MVVPVDNRRNLEKPLDKTLILAKRFQRHLAILYMDIDDFKDTGLKRSKGISVFKTNPSFGLGIPFLILGLGQAIGSIFSGVVADISG